MPRPATATPDVIHETNSIECLENHAPHGKEARAFVECFEQLGTDPRLFFIRCFLTADLFQKMENLEDNVHFTIKDYRHLLEEETALARQMIQTIEQYKKKLGNPEGREELDDLSYTQQHYGNLFKHFSEYHYYEEPYELLTTRLERNDIHIENTASKTALDCGCGGGRYTVALQKLGFKHVIGIDYSDMNIQTARARADAKNMRNIEYILGDVHNLPFEDHTFDFVFCNGVLHHSRSIAKDIEELARVMKPGAEGWLYLINKPGGIHWDTVELLRRIMRPVSQEYARKTLRLLGIPENRVFRILDHIMVPINTRSTAEEIEAMFLANNICNFRRLERGTDFDMIEKIWQLRNNQSDDPELLWKYGCGEHRYFFSKL